MDKETDHNDEYAMQNNSPYLIGACSFCFTPIKKLSEIQLHAQFSLN